MIRTYINKKLLASLILLFFAGCKLSDRDLLAPPSEIKTPVNITISKWLNDHRGAVSLNYDQGDPHLEYGLPVQKLILEYELSMDYELVSYNVLQDSILEAYIKDFMLPNGFGFFGHGYTHINHDALSYDECLVSFKENYNTLMELGIKPVAFAYPGGWGYHLSTRKAVKDAGFLSARKYEQLDISDPFIVPDTVTEPRDWYALPTLVMQSINYDGCVICINNTEELIPFLQQTEEKKAWIILTYHSVGIEDAYGFYELSEFETDLQAIKAHDLWCAKTADIVLYIYERKSARASAELVSDNSGTPKEIRIKISDGLDNNYYSQPLTVIFDIPYNWINKELVLLGGSSETSIRTYTQALQISIPPDESEYKLKLK